MDKILSGLVLINNVDIWKKYGAFLTESRAGGRDNMKALLKPSKTKAHIGVDIREENGTKYSRELKIANVEREVTLHFALIANTPDEWYENYRNFMDFIKKGNKGWLTLMLPKMGFTFDFFYLDSTSFEPLTTLWQVGKQASRFKIKFKEPHPVI